MIDFGDSVPAATLKEFIALAKAAPGKINYASAGSGSGNHLSQEMFKFMAGIDMVHIPYKGSAPAIIDLIGGRVQVMFDSIASALPFIRGGKLRAIAVASNARSPLLPDVPTVAESLPGYSAHSWLGIFVPAGTPQPMVEKLQRELVAVINDPKTRARLVEAGFEPKSSTSEAFAKLVRDEITKWASIVKMSGATPD